MLIRTKSQKINALPKKNARPRDAVFFDEFRLFPTVVGDILFG
jgi:hypothetical protein